MSVYRAMVAYREATDRADCPLSARARLLWANLAARVDHAGACFPDMETLRRAIGERGQLLDRGTVQRARAELVAYAAVDFTAAHGRGRRCEYRLILAAEETPRARGVFAENAALARRFALVDNGENAALAPENAALARAHIGEVGREVEERASIDDDTETPRWRGVSEGGVETAAWAADIIARHYAGEVKTRRRRTAAS